MKSNRTLERLLKRKSSVITNPFFRPLGVQRYDFGSGVPGAREYFNYEGIVGRGIRENGEAFNLAPGWFPFGAYPYVELEEPDDPVDTNVNPFYAVELGDDQVTTGIRMKLTSRTTGDQPPGGLIQRLRRGKQIVGRRVRVSGAYQISVSDDGGTQLPSGVSIWLKSLPTRIEVDPNFFSSSTGGFTALNQIGDLPLLGSGAAPGDLLVVSGQPNTTIRHYVYEISVYGGTSVDVTENFVSIAAGTCDYAISRASDGPASFLGRRGIRFPTDVGHVIRLSEHSIGSDYTEGNELLIRAFDWLAAPINATGQINSHVLHFGPYDLNADYDDNNPATDADPTPLEMGLQGYIPTTGVDAWYIDNNVWDGNPLNGNFELVTDTHAVGSPGAAEGVLRYFDEIIEIPDTLDMSTMEDVFLVVMPIHPDDSSDVNTTLTTTLFALDIEILAEPDSGGDGTLDRLLQSYTNQDPDSEEAGGYDVRHCLRYPIYYPVSYTLKNDWRTEDFVPASWVATDRIFHQGGLNPNGEGLSSVSGASPWPIFANQPRLPQGACVVAVEMGLEFTQNLGAVNPLALYSKMSDRSSYQVNLLAWYDVETPIAAYELKQLRIYRNRVGLFWDQVANSDDFREGAWDLYLRLDNDTPVVGSGLESWPGVFIALVDPRLVPGMMWRF